MCGSFVTLAVGVVVATAFAITGHQILLQLTIVVFLGLFYFPLLFHKKEETPKEEEFDGWQCKGKIEGIPERCDENKNGDDGMDIDIDIDVDIDIDIDDDDDTKT